MNSRIRLQGKILILLIAPHNYFRSAGDCPTSLSGLDFNKCAKSDGKMDLYAECRVQYNENEVYSKRSLRKYIYRDAVEF